jgi:hypothetical protein
MHYTREQDPVRVREADGDESTNEADYYSQRRQRQPSRCTLSCGFVFRLWPLSTITA